MMKYLIPWVILWATLVAALFFATVGTSEGATEDEETSFLFLINEYRAQHGAPPLSLDANLEAAAHWHAADMGQKNYFSHTDSLNRTFSQRLCYFGYCHNTWKGENIAAGYTSASSVFTAWKSSSGHNANMLNPNYRAIGIARVYTSGSTYGYYWVTDFGGVVGNPVVSAPACPDYNGDGRVSILDVIAFKPYVNGLLPYNPKFDRNADGVITVTGDVVLLKPYMGASCAV